MDSLTVDVVGWNVVWDVDELGGNGSITLFRFFKGCVIGLVRAGGAVAGSYVLVDALVSVGSLDEDPAENDDPEDDVVVAVFENDEFGSATGNMICFII